MNGNFSLIRCHYILLYQAESYYMNDIDSIQARYPCAFLTMNKFEIRLQVIIAMRELTNYSFKYQLYETFNHSHSLF